MTSTLTTCPTTRSTGSSCSPTLTTMRTSLASSSSSSSPRSASSFSLSFSILTSLSFSLSPSTQDASGYLDVTRGNIEYDVPACDLSNTRPEDCIYESSTVNFISGEIDADDDSLMSIPYTVGHLHVGGIDVTLYDDDTGEVIGMTPCSFLTPPVFPKNKKVRTVARYNNTESHTGVMGLMLSTMYEVPA